MLTRPHPAVRTGSFKRPAMQVPPPAADHALGGTIDLMGAPMSFPRNAEIYGESDPADFLYKVVSGTVRTYKLLTDGRRQVGGFYVAGDIFVSKPARSIRSRPRPSPNATCW